MSYCEEKLKDMEIPQYDLGTNGFKAIPWENEDRFSLIESNVDHINFLRLDELLKELAAGAAKTIPTRNRHSCWVVPASQPDSNGIIPQWWFIKIDKFEQDDSQSHVVTLYSREMAIGNLIHHGQWDNFIGLRTDYKTACEFIM